MQVAVAAAVSTIMRNDQAVTDTQNTIITLISREQQAANTRTRLNRSEVDFGIVLHVHGFRW